MLRTNVRYVLLCALRDRLFIGLLIGVVAASILSAVLGSTAFLEEREMTLAFAAETTRMVLVVGLIVFVCFHIRSSFDSREIDVMLSRPLSRGQLVIDHWLGFSLVSLCLVLPTLGVMALIGTLNHTGFMWWSVSLLLETWFVVALALFAALLLKSAVSAVMASLGFYVLSRIMIYFIMTAHSTISAGKYPLMRFVLDATSIVMPRLDLFAKSEWLIYGLKTGHEWSLFLTQAAIYIPLLICASIIDFRRKQF